MIWKVKFRFIALCVAVGQVFGKTLYPNETVCSTNYEFEITYDNNITVIADPRNTYMGVGTCQVTFAATVGTIAFNFANVTSNFINDCIVSMEIYQFKDREHHLKHYDCTNTAHSTLAPMSPFDLGYSAITVEINDSGSRNWALMFTVSVVDENAFGQMFGVFALSLGATAVVISLVALCCACCCCKKPQERRYRNQQSMIDQLRRAGYSVTRDYGSTQDTAPLISTGEHEGFARCYQNSGNDHMSNQQTESTQGYRSDLPPSYEELQRDLNICAHPFGAEYLNANSSGSGRNFQMPSSSQCNLKAGQPYMMRHEDAQSQQGAIPPQDALNHYSTSSQNGISSFPANDNTLTDHPLPYDVPPPAFGRVE